jgi:hypothetical protein
MKTRQVSRFLRWMTTRTFRYQEKILTYIFKPYYYLFFFFTQLNEYPSFNTVQSVLLSNVFMCFYWTHERDFEILCPHASKELRGNRFFVIFVWAWCVTSEQTDICVNMCPLEGGDQEGDTEGWNKLFNGLTGKFCPPIPKPQDHDCTPVTWFRAHCQLQVLLGPGKYTRVF